MTELESDCKEVMTPESELTSDDTTAEELASTLDDDENARLLDCSSLSDEPPYDASELETSVIDEAMPLREADTALDVD